MQTSFFIRVSPRQMPHRNWNPFCISHLFLSTSESACAISSRSPENMGFRFSSSQLNVVIVSLLKEGKIRGGTFNR